MLHFPLQPLFSTLCKPSQSFAPFLFTKHFVVSKKRNDYVILFAFHFLFHYLLSTFYSFFICRKFCRLRQNWDKYGIPFYLHFILRSCVHLSLQLCTSFIFHPKIYIIYFPPRYIHPSFSTPKYTSFIFHPDIYILHFPPQNIHHLFSAPKYTSFIFHPDIYILHFPP
jgi:hypothetical protein